MDKIRHVINFDEAVKKPAELSLVERISVVTAKAIFIFLVLAMVILKINYFSRANFAIKILYILLNLYALPLMLKSEELASPVEFRFYDKYLLVHYPKKYYSKKDIRREEFIFKISDIDYLLFLMDKKVLSIRGKARSEHYSFNKDGEVDNQSKIEEGPREVKLDFDLRFLEDLEIIETLEKYTRLQVLVSKG